MSRRILVVAAVLAALPACLPAHWTYDEEAIGPPVVLPAGSNGERMFEVTVIGAREHTATAEVLATMTWHPSQTDVGSAPRVRLLVQPTVSSDFQQSNATDVTLEADQPLTAYAGAETLFERDCLSFACVDQLSFSYERMEQAGVYDVDIEWKVRVDLEGTDDDPETGDVVVEIAFLGPA